MAQKQNQAGGYPELVGQKLLVLKKGDQHQPDLGQETLVIYIDEKNEGRIVKAYFA